MAVVRQHHDQLMKEMLASVKGRWAMPDEAPPPTTINTPASSSRPAESQQKLFKKSASDCYQPTQPPVTVRSEASEWRRAQPTTRSRASGADVTSSADSGFPTQLRSVSVEKQRSYSEESSLPQRVGLAAVQKPAAASEVLQPQLRVTSAVAVRLGPRPYAPPSDSLGQGQSEMRSQAVFSPTAAWTGQSYAGSSAGASTTSSSRRQPPSGRSQDDSSLFTAVRVLTSPVGRVLNAESPLERRSAAVAAADQPQLNSSSIDRHSQDSHRAKQSVRRPQDDSGLPKMATNGWQSPLSPSSALFRGDRLTNLERTTASSSSPRTSTSASFSMPPQPSPKEAGAVGATANGDRWSPSANAFHESRFSSLRRTTSSSSTTSSPAKTTGPGTAAAAAAAASFSTPPSDRSSVRGRDPRSGASFGGSAAAAEWSTGSSASTGSGADSSGWLWSPSPSKEFSSSSPKSVKNGNGGSGSSGSSAIARNVPLDRGFSSDSASIAGFSSGQASHLARDRSRSMVNSCTVASSSVAPFSHSAEQPYARSASCQPPGNGYLPGNGSKYAVDSSKRSASSSSLANQLQRQLCLDINDMPLDADDRVSVSELIQEFNGLSPPPPQTPSAYATQQGASTADVLFSPRASSAASSPRILQLSSRSTSAEAADSPAGHFKGSEAAARRQAFDSPPLTTTSSTSVAPRERNTLTNAGSRELNGYAKNGTTADVAKQRDRAQQFSFDVASKANGGASRLKIAYSQDDGLVLSKRGGALSPKLKLDFANDPKILGYCAVCDEAISAFVGGCVSMGKKYHVSCLVCCQCGKELAEQTFYTIEGKPHCRDCFSSTLERCSACDEVITGKLLRAAGSVYHLSCFVCAICKCFLEGKQFVLGEDNRPLCVDDYYENFAPKCDGCRKPIIPGDGQESALQVRVFNRCFHVACCKCEICGKAILTQTSQEAACYPLDGRIVCKACGMSRVYTSTGALP